MAVSRKEILPETTVDLHDLEIEVDRQLRLPSTLEMLNKYKVAVVSVFGMNIENLVYYDFSKKYSKLGWSVDTYASENVVVLFFT